MFRLMRTIVVGLAVFTTVLESAAAGADDADSTGFVELKPSAASLGDLIGRKRPSPKAGPGNLESNPTKEDALIASRLQTYWKSVSGGFQTQQSCSIEPLGRNTFVAEARLGPRNIVLALDHYGRGRIGYYGDMTTIKSLLQGFPDLVTYLGRNKSPKTLVFGYPYFGEQLGRLPGLVFAGAQLPAKYEGRSAVLAKDYDLVIFCARSAGWQASTAATLRDFTAVKGRGLLLVGDYYGAALRDSDFDMLNSVANEAGAQFNKVSLGWGKAAFSK